MAHKRVMHEVLFAFVLFECFLMLWCILLTEKKRRVYDQYGKEGLGQNGERHHRHRRTHGYENGYENGYDPFFEQFTFRDPDDVFREFFGSSPFDSIFKSNRKYLLLWVMLFRCINRKVSSYRLQFNCSCYTWQSTIHLNTDVPTIWKLWCVLQWFI